jgi:hypothetical protein
MEESIDSVENHCGIEEREGYLNTLEQPCIEERAGYLNT